MPRRSAKDRDHDRQRRGTKTLGVDFGVSGRHNPRFPGDLRHFPRTENPFVAGCTPTASSREPLLRSGLNPPPDRPPTSPIVSRPGSRTPTSVNPLPQLVLRTSVHQPKVCDGALTPPAGGHCTFVAGWLSGVLSGQFVGFGVDTKRRGSGRWRGLADFGARPDLARMLCGPGAACCPTAPIGGWCGAVTAARQLS